jgi:hypothetical protein
MNAEFNWWLLIVGLVVGAAIVYLLLADASRREADETAEERPREATWIATVMRSEGQPIEPPAAERVLELHRAYLAAPPPDESADEPEAAGEAPDPGADGTASTNGRGGELEPVEPVERSAPRHHADVQRD